MKKLISVALAGVMALSLAACGSTPASEPASGSTAASAASGSSTASASASTESKQYIFSVDELTGKTVGVQLGTTGDIYAKDIEGATVEQFNKFNDAVLALKQGKVDAVIIDNEPGKVFVEQNPDITMLDEDFAVEDYAIGVQEGNTALLNALNTALNKITGKWDNQLLKDLLVELDLEGYDFSVTGFQRTDLEDLIQLTEVPPEAQEDDFDPDAAAEAIDVPVSRAGSIWRLGRHRLMCGDATDPDDVAQLLSGEKLDLVITDPPYNVDYGAKTEFLEAYLGQEGSRKNSTIENDHMDTGSFYSFLLAAFQNFNEAMRPGAAIYVFHAESTGLQFRQAYADAGLKLSQCLVWEKNAFVMGRSDYQWRHEPILYGWKEGAAHYFVNDRTQDTVFLEDELELKKMNKQQLLALIEKVFRDYKDQTTVHYENKPTRNALHPTMKPVPLVGRLMNNSSRPGWAVGDFFGGSGTTLIAAEQLGRTAYLMEYDPRNTDIIVQRWEQLTGEKAVLANG